MTRIKKYFDILIHDPGKFFRKTFLRISHMKFLKFFMSQKLFIQIEYYEKFGKKLNLQNPQTYNEKLQWLKIYDHNPLYNIIVDKYEARDFITKRIGEGKNVPLIGVYNSVEEIPFNRLPTSYVLKCTHDSGTVIIIKPDNTKSVNEIKQILKKSLKNNYYYEHREWCYKDLKPRIICEEIIFTLDNLRPKDYKVFCFDGEPKYIYVISNRGLGTRLDAFDLEWNRIPVIHHFPNSQQVIDKPDMLEDMIAYAKMISSGLIHTRIDFYIDGYNQLLCGEITLYPSGGVEKFSPVEYDLYFGSFLKLP